MPNINELLEGHVTLEVECIDRLYLNGYLPSFATGGGLVRFLTEHLGKPIPSPVLLGQITQSWAEALKRWAAQQGIPLIHFQHGERKDEVAPTAASATRGPRPGRVPRRGPGESPDFFGPQRREHLL